jgi:hypothetical protein
MSNSEIAFVSNILTSDVSNSEKKIAASGGSFGETPAEGFTTSGGAPAEGIRTTKVVHCKHDRYDVYIGRPSIFGNPFYMKNESCREEVISKYKKYFETRIERDAQFRTAVEALRGKRIACYCSPRKCHGDIIAEYLTR